MKLLVIRRFRSAEDGCGSVTIGIIIYQFSPRLISGIYRLRKNNHIPNLRQDLSELIENPMYVYLQVELL
jgi:hypothetical protein